MVIHRLSAGPGCGSHTAPTLSFPSSSPSPKGGSNTLSYLYNKAMHPKEIP